MIDFNIKNTCLVLFLGLFLNLSAQGSNQQIQDQLIGHWQGAFIKNNSFQKIDIQFFKSQDKLSSLQIIEEWHPQFGEFVLPVSIDSLNQIVFNTGQGKAIMHMDEKSLELTGIIEGSLPSVFVHFKKIPDPPKPLYKVEEVNIENGAVKLFGHLHEPAKSNSTAIILVGGRGCYAGNTKYDLYAKLLRSYGISVLVFNKRGTGNSSGDCSKATISDLASDVEACKKFLEQHSNKYTKIGVLGSSAGAWVMTKAEENVDFDFMISIVGPSTSLLDQQLQSMKYGLEFYNLSDKAKTDLATYTNLLFESKASEESFQKFNSLLEDAKADGWMDLLDDTDIPKSVEGIDNLWVRRHRFDPENTLRSFKNPFLAIYGEIDWIVPYKENVAKLNEFFSDERKDLLTVVVANDAEHGTETKGKYIDLGGNKSYWRFFRIAPSVQIEIVDFLKENGLIEN